MQRWQPTWYVLNPKVVQKFRETYVDRGKTDRADAALIADVMRFGRVTPWTPPDPRYAALQVLTRHRRQLSHLITQEKIARWCNCSVSGGEYAHTDEPFFFERLWGSVANRVGTLHARYAGSHPAGGSGGGNRGGRSPTAESAR
ncbi:IS110 family transposase [Sulfobacillus thermosulfidooxidans]|uniref:IS110 family transposase n=1 Tax=Sulfobacillus thermosulfidooxidans TaxID=28034 RepID=UPI003BF9F10E